MSKKLNIEGQRFGKLTVISYAYENKDKRNQLHHYWNCLCDCGNKKIVRQHDLIYGSTKSCGCIKHGIDLKGRKFGRWTVIKEVNPIIRKDGKGQKKAWLCRCECGNERVVIQELLLNGNSKSCGCYQRDIAKSRKNPTAITIKFNRLYKIWLSMRNRCNNPSDQHHKYYYDRGIKVCDEWNKSFSPFLEWALSNGYEDNLSIDRIDVNGNYEPSNCRWTTNTEQQRNKTNTAYYEIFGKLYRTDEIEKEFGINKITFVARIERYGYTPEEAAAAPIKHPGRKKS